MKATFAWTATFHDREGLDSAQSVRTRVAVVGGNALQDAAVLHQRGIVLCAVLEQQVLAAVWHGHRNNCVVRVVDGSGCHKVAEIACCAAVMTFSQLV